MSTKKKNTKQFKTSLKQLPDTIYEEVAALLAKHGVKNVRVDRIRVTPLEARYETQEECEAAGKIWQCDIIPGRPDPYCRCLNSTTAQSSA